MNDEALKKAKELLILIESLNTALHQVKYVAQDFNELGIEYCVVGGVALSPHNYMRYTEDIDILVAKKDITKLEILIGSGYTYRPGSKKNMYYHTGAKSKIQIDILYEGDNKDGFVMPRPKNIRQKISGIWYINLPKLIEMKLITARAGDTQDVLQLIDYNDLDADYVENLAAKCHKLFLSLLR
ncbi:MAG: hypothetical protein B7C24_15330 [Bacteroidetes bacterium 4572_77]|nr:MAG: hypothetical protein B7C24_15330 [Bacteroidetes bacterium 4572_77]